MMCSLIKEVGIALSFSSLLVIARPVVADTAQPAPAPAKACQFSESASLDIIINPEGGFSVPGEIQGRAGNFVVDTGGDIDMLSGSVAQDIGMRPRRFGAELIVAGGIHLNAMVLAAEFKLGRLVATWRPFVLAPPAFFGSDSIGLIGPRTLANYDVEIDFVKGKLNLFKMGECSSHPVYWTHDPVAAVPMTLDGSGHINIPVWINGKLVHAIVDTGAEKSVINLDIAADVMGIEKTDSRFKPTGDAMINGKAGTSGYTYPFPALQFEGIAVQNPDILIVDSAHMGRGSPDMVIGMNVVRHLHMYIAYHNNLLFLTAAEAH
jgi:predicted aspartyl protease